MGPPGTDLRGAGAMGLPSLFLDFDEVGALFLKVVGFILGVVLMSVALTVALGFLTIMAIVLVLR